MPVHDWTRVDAGVFHDFHLAWVCELSRAMNGGLLDGRHYSLVEEHRNRDIADIITHCRAPDPTFPHAAVDDELAWYTSRRRTLTVRDEATHRAVALVLTVTPGDKLTARAWREFKERKAEMLAQGLHLLILDLFPPHPSEPNADRALVAYSAAPVRNTYIESLAVGQSLHNMPLFLTSHGVWYVEVPLEQTYQAAYSPLPRHLRDILDAPVNT